MPKPKNALELFQVQRPLYEDFTRKLEILLIDLLKLKKINFQLIESRAKSIESLQEKLSGPGKSYDNPLEPDQKVVESDESVVILCRGTLFEEEVARCGPDLPRQTIPLFKLDRTPMEGMADTAVASM